MQLLPSVSASPTTLESETYSPGLANDPAVLAKVCDDEEVQALWKQGVIVDSDWRRA